MRSEAPALVPFKVTTRWLACALLLTAAVALAACGKANGDDAKDGNEEARAVPVRRSTSGSVPLRACTASTAGTATGSCGT